MTPAAPESTVDLNITPYRPDLAAAYLRGRLTAERYAEGTEMRVTVPRLPMRGRADRDAPWTSELLMGEAFVVYERKDGWAWGQSAEDGYVGYVEDCSLDATAAAPTHRIEAISALVYPAADLKREPIAALSYGARVALLEASDKFARLAGGGWVALVALSSLDVLVPDYVATAERFLGVPYLWGGRTSAGLDCSGLVQIALMTAGHATPRDSYLQEQAVGEPVPSDEWDRLRRGDLVFFPGHVGIMTDGTMLVHANATAMAVSRDPLTEVARRVAGPDGAGAGITSVRRISGDRPAGQ